MIEKREKNQILGVVKRQRQEGLRLGGGGGRTVILNRVWLRETSLVATIYER